MDYFSTLLSEVEIKAPKPIYKRNIIPYSKTVVR